MGGDVDMVRVQEVEDTADDGQWWQIIADWMEDLVSQDIPGSVVVLIVVVAFLPRILKAITAWLGRGVR